MRRQRGFTLVELIIVIVLVGVIGGIFAMQLRPTILGYLAVGKRAALTDQANTALRRIVTEVRAAVPNSLRLANAQCLELVPTIDGGRFRAGPDVTKTGGEASLDYDSAVTEFDVMTPFTTRPAPNDLVVIGNQNPGDVYGRTNVSTITEVLDHTGADTWRGVHRLRVTATRIPFGYEDGRFVVVPGGEQAVSYVCTGAGLVGGRGQGTLHRVTRPIAAVQSCAVPADSPLLASNVASCEFIYSPNQGATQQSGFVQLQLTLADGGESVPLTLGAHVSNVP
ncbi:prepilin-type N-terminal cleavage/methylation domain-containing protein [Massilia sp. IC2-476]|uniref:prepilin-type N-terminal cleavage/methylation domain-containing protein n=1 Tax=Massilia sp. IC2-476 TaxID=2887199 RepID=UPI001D11E6CC|nr:prepilin-type N-terminal cleavage/methylation domain-containing protein [Massilia sp. IC2-476]MCC2972686.1 prepilin-type N-terminal cleavage/methylation domain-containing protein [Massilia sp. IC2-476]